VQLLNRMEVDLPTFRREMDVVLRMARETANIAAHKQ
jgi:hypothetical protein